MKNTSSFIDLPFVIKNDKILLSKRMGEHAYIKEWNEDWVVSKCCISTIKARKLQNIGFKVKCELDSTGYKRDFLIFCKNDFLVQHISELHPIKKRELDDFRRVLLKERAKYWNKQRKYAKRMKSLRELGEISVN